MEITALQTILSFIANLVGILLATAAERKGVCPFIVEVEFLDSNN